MEKRQEEFLKKLLEEFKVEAAEHRQAIVDGLMEFDNNPDPDNIKIIIESVFREVHSLKGAARSVNLTDVERLCQAAEALFSFLKNGEMKVSPELVDLFHVFVNTLDILLPLSGAPLSPDEAVKLSGIVSQLQKASKGEEPEPARLIQPVHTVETVTATSTVTAGGTETVRISISKLTGLFLQAEELITTKLKGLSYISELKSIHSQLSALRKKEESGAGGTGSGDSGSTDTGVDETLHWHDLKLKTIESDIQVLYRKMEQEFRTLGRVLDGLLGNMKKSLMFPVSSVLDIMPKLVRDLARDSNKTVSLVIRGGETEIDRRILEEIKDPLIHIIRNCVDYGIEVPDVRTGKGKDPCGIITIDVKKKDSRNVEIAISDDGAGIDRESVLSAAVKSGIIPAEKTDSLSERDVMSLIFRSGVSTSPIITDISGRGIGLAIVQEKAEKLGGSVTVETEPGSGTTFRFVLPLTQATFRGVIVKAGGQVFIMPIQNIERVIRIKKNDIGTVENRETVSLNGEIIPLLPLEDVLGMQGGRSRGDREYYQAVVTDYARRHIAFTVDDVIGEQEGIIKNLGMQLQGVRNIAGATVSGSGEVIPILDIADIMKSAATAGTDRELYVNRDAAVASEHTILVAEDSVTSRSLLRNIIESAGYSVKTAVDGIDALTTIRGGGIDLLVSDVDMPRMNGFELTGKIRADSRFSSLPVVLVTALDSREDREKGIDAGANAYIVKSSFDQSNLIEVIKRLT